MSPSPDALTQDDLRSALEYFWHPVCTVAELDTVSTGVIGRRLLGRDLAIARFADGSVAALDDRCLHRSTRLSIGTVEDAGIRCSYHGWKWDGCGRCVHIPAMPETPIPPKAVVGAYSAEVRYDLVWVRLVEGMGTEIPACPAFGDETFRVLGGQPYTWPVAAPRRVENFVDLAHFAWVHDGSLGRREDAVPPLPVVERTDGELRFTYDPPELNPDASAMYGFSEYRMPMPCTVNIDFRMSDGARRMLWMTASPVDDATTRAFWFMARSDDLDGPDEPHIEFQRLVLREDEPVVCNQVPGEFPMDVGSELSVRTDRVSIEYRRWIRDLVGAALDGPSVFDDVLRKPLTRKADDGV